MLSMSPADMITYLCLEVPSPIRGEYEGLTACVTQSRHKVEPTEDRLCIEEHREVKNRRFATELTANTTKGMPQHVHKDNQFTTQITVYSVDDR